MGGTLLEGFRHWINRRLAQVDNSPPPAEASSGPNNSGSQRHLRLQQSLAGHHAMQQGADSRRKTMAETEFFTEYGEASRYKILEVIGKGSYGVVCSATDMHTGDKVAIKKINDIFEHVSDATRILREIKLLRLLRHPDIVEIKHIMLPPSRREFKDIYVVFELMESDLHQVIKANDDLTPEHYQFFLYQLLRALKYIHTANVFHRDLKPKNILANADCKLKICDFGLARVAFNDAPTAIFWTDYVATRWYRAPELCGSFFSKYTPAIDIWSIGCIFAEILTGKPLFPGKNVVHQLDLMTDMLGTPSAESVARVRNEKARRYLSGMRKKTAIPFTQKFPNADPLALRLLERLLAFDPKDRPTAEEALADPYFRGLAKVEREPSAQPITKMEFEFERRRISKDDVRELIYREILEYHPQMLEEYLNGTDHANFMYPSAVDQFKRQFAQLEEHYGKGGNNNAAVERHHASLPRPATVYSSTAAAASDCSSKEREYHDSGKFSEKPQQEKSTRAPQKGGYQGGLAAKPGKVVNSGVSVVTRDTVDARRLVKSASISSSLQQYTASVYSYGRRTFAKSDRDDKKDNTGEFVAVQPKGAAAAAAAATEAKSISGMTATRKVAAAVQNGRTY
ncbi:mitogen-activated protein kinase 15 isoform X1 [Selaginella moellendorffii]|uniref:mitogen-activated protein kinase 15 isoform X1 n=1 Tax=Selaginella moellendorffii TaxID=88036 RepID=UPI000D1C2505|nr:mitogen-activated protein kinase 15 isoform X1 [Selaginella moellendorffii]|eukprot:XP_024527404.1 mitogen-activated protein kinase 15 isoform X1 [Selaginella moellendorffii]